MQVIKMIFFLKINESFGLLILLIVEVFSEIIVFTLFLILWIFAFAIVFLLIGAEFAHDDYPALEGNIIIHML